MTNIALLFKKHFAGIKRCYECKSLFVSVATRVSGDRYQAHCRCKGCGKDWRTMWFTLALLRGKPGARPGVEFKGGKADCDDCD